MQLHIHNLNIELLYLLFYNNNFYTIYTILKIVKKNKIKLFPDLKLILSMVNILNFKKQFKTFCENVGKIICNDTNSSINAKN